MCTYQGQKYSFFRMQRLVALTAAVAVVALLGGCEGTFSRDIIYDINSLLVCHVQNPLANIAGQPPLIEGIQTISLVPGPRHSVWLPQESGWVLHLMCSLYNTQVRIYRAGFLINILEMFVRTSFDHIFTYMCTMYLQNQCYFITYCVFPTSTPLEKCRMHISSSGCVY